MDTYEITLEREVLREKSAGILADFNRCTEENLGYETVGDIYRNIFKPEYNSLRKLHKANKELDLAKEMLGTFYNMEKDSPWENDVLEDFTKDEFNEKLNEIYKELTKGVKKSENKKAFILGGQPGAGKSALDAMIEMENEVVFISGDDFRSFHPRYPELKKKYGEEYVLYTQKFSGQITEGLIEKVSSEGYNLVVEGTLRTPEVPLKTCKVLKEKGYSVELFVVKVRPEISLLGTFRRFEKMKELGTTPRETPIEHHNKVAEKISHNLDFIYRDGSFDSIKIYNRNGEKLYSSEDTPDINPCHMVNETFKRELNEKEINFLKENYKHVHKLMRRRRASEDEMNRVENERSKILNK